MEAFSSGERCLFLCFGRYLTVTDLPQSSHSTQSSTTVRLVSVLVAEDFPGLGAEPESSVSRRKGEINRPKVGIRDVEDLTLVFMA